jgi:hypothetical protein
MAAKLDTATVGSPGWWLKRLETQLHTRAMRFNRLDRYYLGEHDLPEGDQRAREVFKSFQRRARSNFTALVVDSVRERMRVTGFRTGAQGDAAGDAESWRVWQANNMDAWQILVHQASLSMSEAYVIVGPNDDDARTPLITPEDPRQVTVELDPRDRKTVRAALKTWRDDTDKSAYAIVYLPGEIHYFARNGADWELWEAPAANTLGVVPVVQFLNRPRLMPFAAGLVPMRFDGAPGIGEFEDVLDIQDRINGVILDRLVITKMQAYRQRWVKGVQTTDENGDQVDLPFIPGVDMLWAVEDAEAQFGDFTQSDIMPILNATKEDVRQLAAITRTPPHYLVGEMSNVNGATLKATETGLVSKTKERCTFAGESWERVMWLTARYAGGDDTSTPRDTEVVWDNIESQTLAELADAAVKTQQAGVTWRARMEMLGYSPQEISRMETERVQDALIRSQLAPAPVAQPQQGAQGVNAAETDTATATGSANNG